MLDESELIPTPVAYRVGKLRVEQRAGDLWAITDRFDVLNTKNEWEYEPQPSSRSPEFLMRCRFPLVEALKRAQAIQRA